MELRRDTNERISSARLKDIIQEMQVRFALEEAPMRERAAFAVSLLQQAADRYGLVLKLRKKPDKKA